jgi:polysaccharide biosynthesis transport protein
MQRSNNNSGEYQMPSAAPLATPQSTNYYIPGMPMAPGQTMATTATARTWPTLIELVNSLKRRLVLATFLGILVGMAAAAAIWLSMPNGKHRSKALLQIKQSNKLGANQIAATETEFDNFRKREEVLIKGRMLLQRVISEPNVAKLNDVRTADDPVRWLQESIQVQWDAPDLMSVAMRGDDVKAIENVVNTLIDIYLKESNTDELKDRGKNRSQLDKNLEDINKQITVREERMKNAVKLGVGGTPEANAMNIKLESELLRSIVADKNENNKKLRELNILLKQLEFQAANMGKVEVTTDDLEKALAKNEVMRPKFEERAEARAMYEKNSARLESGSELLERERKKLAEMEKKVRDAMEDLRPSVEKDIRADKRQLVDREIARSKQQIEFSNTLIKQLELDETLSKKKIDSLNANGLVMGLDAEDLKPWKDARAQVLNQLLALDSLDKAETRVILREKASVTLNQNLNQKVLLSVAAFLAGCITVMLAVAFLEWRSRRVDSVDQVMNDLGLRVIGTIPAFPSKQSLKSGDAAQSQNWRFVLNESVNSARTMLLHTAKTQNMQVLMVTSAMQGEGKTSLASQLATSMATAGLRTLILDCDLRNPSMHKLFDAPLTPGCAEVLCQEIDVSDAVQPTSVPNLWLIPAGQCSNRVITALAQGHPLETLFNRLRGQFDFIVVDSCPVLPVADSLLVGQHVDGVVISILQDISQLPKVMTASEKLTLLNIPLLGAVVNGIKPDIHAYGYNYVKQLPA